MALVDHSNPEATLTCQPFAFVKIPIYNMAHQSGAEAVHFRAENKKLKKPVALEPLGAQLMRVQLSFAGLFLHQPFRCAFGAALSKAAFQYDSTIGTPTYALVDPA